MVVTAELTVPTDAFALGRLFRDVPDAVVEFEPLVPFRDGSEASTPLVWIGGADPDSVRTALRDADYVGAIDRLATVDGQTLFELAWRDDLDGVVGPLLGTGGWLLEASGTAERWTFRLLFDSHVSLSEFNMAVTGNGIPVTLRRLENGTVRRGATGPADGDALLPNHRETLLFAYRNGYYDSPRRCQLATLAQQEGVSDSALSKRIRRATASLIEETLLPDEEVEVDGGG